MHQGMHPWTADGSHMLPITELGFGVVGCSGCGLAGQEAYMVWHGVQWCHRVGNRLEESVWEGSCATCLSLGGCGGVGGLLPLLVRCVEVATQAPETHIHSGQV